jgi:hypothetical protein
MRTEFYILCILTLSFKGVTAFQSGRGLIMVLKLHLSEENEEKLKFGWLGCRPKFKYELHK